MQRGDGPAVPDTGRRIGNRYRLGERIGRGGMASVYRAHDEQLDREVALKVMRADLGEDPRFVQRFEAEARRAASVSHPSVVSVYDVGTDGPPYMVMELIEGGDVARLLATEGRQAPARAARLAVDAAAALQAAHDAGLVHRDVKPGNILLRADGRAMVADFGIARATGEDGMTRTGATLGSVEYFSPEQARGERAGPASDIYALGVVLYELLTGTRPFRGDSPYAVATARLRMPPPDPREIVPDLPAGLAAIVLRAMARQPEERFVSAGAMRADLAAWLTNSEAEATPIPGAAAAGGRRPADTQIGPPVAAGAPAPAAPMPARRERSVGAWPLALLLLALIGGGYLGGRLLSNAPGGDALASVVVGIPGGQVTATASATPQPTAPSTASPAPTPTIAPPTPTPAPPAPTAAPAAAPTAAPPIAAAAPDDAVAAFYGHAEAGRFDEAYALWSDRMRATYPRQSNLDDRFAQTADITFSTLYVAEQSTTTATVQANFTETYDSGASRRFVGYWRLVRVDGRWLLDEPNY